MAEQLDLLTLSVADFPARTSASPEPAQDSPAQGPGCGPTCTESCERCGPLGSLLRTCLLCELEALTPSTLEWEQRVTPAGFSWWVLTTSERATDDDELGESSDEWPTPTATPYGSSNNGSPGDGREIYATAGKPSLETMAREWPTPTVNDAKNRGGPAQLERHKMALNVMAQPTWPTPTAGDAEDSNAHPGISLTDAAVHGLTINDTASRVWSTPAAQESRLGYQRRPEGMASLQNQQSLTTDVFDEDFPPPPGQPQHAWEAARTVTDAECRLGAAADGLPAHLGPTLNRARLKAGGNSIVPLIAECIGRVLVRLTP